MPCTVRTLAHSPNPGFRADLLRAGILHRTSVEGLYIRSERFERVAQAVDHLVSSAGADENAEALYFPPVIPREVLERSGYVRSLPDLVGIVSTFEGDDAAHAEILYRLDRGSDWGDIFEPSQVALCPAACHLVYPRHTGSLPPGGLRFEVFGHCFRHELSPDPARMQAFRQHEFVYIGDPDMALKHRDMWLERAAHILAGLGLAIEAVLTTDAFFGRLGRLLSERQRAEALKHEIVAQADPGTGAIAVASSNYHLDHFGRAFEIVTAQGAVAHSACVGFATERITLALMAAHGVDSDAWRPEVRELLWPSASGA